MFEEPNCSISMAALSPVWSIKISLSAKRPPDNKNKLKDPSIIGKTYTTVTILDKKDRKKCGPIAPPEGLYLKKIF